MAAIAEAEGLDFDDEGDRFEARAEVSAAIRPWIASRTVAEVAARFDELGVCWGRYQTFKQLVDDDPRCSVDGGLFREVDQPQIGTYLSPGSPLAFDGALAVEPTPAPRLGEHTEEILAEDLGLTTAEIGSLRANGTVA